MSYLVAMLLVSNPKIDTVSAFTVSSILPFLLCSALMIITYTRHLPI